MRYLDLIGHFFIVWQFLKVQKKYVLGETFYQIFIGVHSSYELIVSILCYLTYYYHPRYVFTIFWCSGPNSEIHCGDNTITDLLENARIVLWTYSEAKPALWRCVQGLCESHVREYQYAPIVTRTVCARLIKDWFSRTNKPKPVHSLIYLINSWQLNFFFYNW